MNIFVLDTDPHVAAMAHTDNHVDAQVVDCIHMLAVRRNDTVGGATCLVDKSQKNHPCRLWTHLTLGNWLWVRQYALSLCGEHAVRTNQHHRLTTVIRCFLQPKWINNDRKRTPFCQHVPDEFKQDDTIQAYRAYYAATYLPYATYTQSQFPLWYTKEQYDEHHANEQSQKAIHRVAETLEKSY